MAETTSAGQVVADAVSEPRRVPFDAPWEWLAAGWNDMWRIPGVSLFYGGIFAGAAALLALSLWWVEAQSVFLALAGGFMLLGPLLGVGLYEASRQLAAGHSVRLSDVAGAAFGARGQLAFFGVILLFIYLVWMQFGFLLLMLFQGGNALPPPSQFMQLLLFTPRGLGLLIVGSAVGGVLASIVFAISAVGVPMLLDKRVDAVSAARASIAAVVANPKPMALWAALIAVLMGAGFVMLLVGVAVAFPLIGHATWHAYEDIYGSRKGT